MSQNDESELTESWPTDQLQHEPSRVIDDDGVRWTIAERPNSFDRRRGRSLVFESDAAVRRVRNYPSDWHSLDDAALIALSRSR